MKRILIFALFFAALLSGSSVIAQNKVQGGMVVRKLTYHQKEKKLMLTYHFSSKHL